MIVLEAFLLLEQSSPFDLIPFMRLPLVYNISHPMLILKVVSLIIVSFLLFLYISRDQTQHNFIKCGFGNQYLIVFKGTYRESLFMELVTV